MWAGVLQGDTAAGVEALGDASGCDREVRDPDSLAGASSLYCLRGLARGS